MQKINYGIIIKNMRKKCGLTQTALGNLVWLDKTTISAYECNKIMPPTDVFFSICDVCNFEIIFKNDGNYIYVKDINREK